ncbi:MAG: EthD family reductase [Chloroflexota bacterium]
MYKLVTIYRRVDDEAALEKFFSETHLPLAEQLPGLVKSEVSRVTGKPGGESRFHLMYELYFASRESYQQAMVSQTGLALIQALTPWWKGKIIDWFYAESFEEEAGARAEAREAVQAAGGDEEE